MKVFNIGEMIRLRRIECGFSQEELCFGICEQPTLSRIESGATTPSRSRLTALLQRLGLVHEKYFFLLSENELEVANLQSEITSCIVRRDFSEGLSKLEKLEQIAEYDDHIIKQYILKSRVAFGKEVDGEIIPYNFDERLAMLYEAIRMTVPNFEIEKIDQFVLGADEIKIINQIATTYALEKKYPEAFSIYSKLINYIEAHLRTLNHESASIPVSILVSYNYACALNYYDQYSESIAIADIGLKHSKNLRNSSYLGSLLYVKAYSLHFLGNHEESKRIFYQAYYLYSALDDSANVELTRKTILKLYNIELCD